MSDLSPRDPTGDERASAYLDGVATPDERAAVEADARLGARVEELRAVRTALAMPVVARPAVAVDTAIAAALAAADADEQAPGETVASPRPPAAARSGIRRRPVLLVVLGAAAAVVAVVTVAALRPADDAVKRAGGAASTLATEQAPRASAAAGIAAASTVGAATTGAATGGATTALAVASTATSSQADGAGGGGAALPALGPIDDAADLRTALRPRVSGDLSAADRSAAGVACGVPDAAPVATVEWQGIPAVVFVDRGGTAVVVNQSTCATLATVPLS
jgi:hypothetical protein